MNCHRVILRDNRGNLIQEARYYKGVLYRQNRSYDLEICFDDFIDRIKKTKEAIKNNRHLQGHTVTCDLINSKEKWLTI